MLNDTKKRLLYGFFSSDIGKCLIRARQPLHPFDLSRIYPISEAFGTDRGQGVNYYYVMHFLNKYKQYIQGEVLEIQEDSYARHFSEQVKRMHILHVAEGNPHATLVGDLTRPETLPEAIADCFICTYTLNSIYHKELALRGIFKLLKPGGIFIGIEPGLCQITRYDHERWGDYWRFTDQSLRRLFEDSKLEVLDLNTYGNAGAAMALLQGLCVEDLPSREMLLEHHPDYQISVAILARKTLTP